MRNSLFVLLAAAILLPGCASVSVKDRKHSGGKVSQPKQIYVAPFSTSGGTFNVAGAKNEAKLAAFKENTAKLLADYTVSNVTKHVAPASKVATPAAAPRDGWLVAGRFERVNTGNRGMRVIVGLGAGGSKMETEVEVFDLAVSRTKPFLRFKTTGGSNAMPGMITSGGPGVGTAYNMIYQANSGVTDDAARTSRMITAALSEYFAERGWPTKGKVFRTKEPGKFQIVHGM
jgi:hypothetical protein